MYTVVFGTSDGNEYYVIFAALFYDFIAGRVLYVAARLAKLAG
jgi:hypothetical protein